MEFFEFGLKKMGLKAEEVIYVGDRVDRDIEPAKELGMTTIRILKGKYKDMEGESDYTVTKLPEIVDIVRNLIEK